MNHKYLRAASKSTWCWISSGVNFDEYIITTGTIMNIVLWF